MVKVKKKCGMATSESPTQRCQRPGTHVITGYGWDFTGHEEYQPVRCLERTTEIIAGSQLFSPSNLSMEAVDP